MLRGIHSLWERLRGTGPNTFGVEAKHPFFQHTHGVLSTASLQDTDGPQMCHAKPGHWPDLGFLSMHWSSTKLQFGVLDGSFLLALVLCLLPVSRGSRRAQQPWKEDS